MGCKLKKKCCEKCVKKKKACKRCPMMACCGLSQNCLSSMKKKEIAELVRIQEAA